MSHLQSCESSLRTGKSVVSCFPYPLEVPVVRVKRFFASLSASALLMVGVAAPAAMAQNQDGLVNVAVGDVTILEDVNVGVAAQVAANICGVSVGPVAVLGQAVDRSGNTRTVCTTDQGPIRLEQN